MNRKMHFRTLLPLLVILSMLLAAVHTTPVYAQSEEPPATEPAVTEPTGEEPAGGDPPATETGKGEPTGSETPATEPAAGEQPAPETTVTEPAGSESPAAESGEVVAAAVEALAENELVLVGAQGEALPLASQDAAQVLVTTDPYFYHASCAGGKCTYGTFAAALTDFAAKSASGFIYVEGNATYTEAVTINGATAGYGGLTGLKWRQADGTAVAGEVAPIINNNITISNFSHAFDLYGLTVNGGVTLNNIAGTINLTEVQVDGGSGIDITGGSGAINMNKVISTDSIDHGIAITNRSGNVSMYRTVAEGNKSYGAYVDATGTVKIGNSTFDYNGVDNAANDGGLFVTNSAAISLVGVSASENRGNGAYFDEVNAGLTVRNSIFDNNADATITQGFGLWAGNASNKGNLTFDGVFANKNDQSNWTLQTNGNILLNSIEGKESVSGYGADLQTLGVGTVTIVDADFSSNTNNYGLDIVSNGNVILNGVTVANSGLYGANIDNASLPGKTVTVLASNFSYNQGDSGLNVIASGMITLNNVTSRGNNGAGIYLDNTAGTAGVSLLNTLGSNEIRDNHNGGLSISSNGALVLNGVDVIENENYGAWMDNCQWADASGACKGTGAVTITRSNFDYTWYNGSLAPDINFGLSVYSRGLITLNNVSVSDDSQGHEIGVGVSGAKLQNAIAGSTAGVSILSTLGENRFNGTQGIGLNIESNGLVSLNDLEASNNSEYGAFIVANNNVTIKNGAFTSNKDKAGLWVKGSGTITLNQVKASGNGVLVNNNPEDADSTWAYGAMLDNSASSTAKTITVSRGWFSNNYGDGLVVKSKGNVLLDGIQATGNSSYHMVEGSEISHNGVQVNTAGTLTMSSTLGRNDLNGNSFNGLSATATGKITLTNVYARDNDKSGFLLTSQSDMALTNLQGDGNGGGLTLTTNGMVNLKQSGFRSNAQYNALIDNTGATATAPKAVTINNSIFNICAFGYGLQVLSDGLITLNSVTASNNAGAGAMLLNTTGTTAGVIVQTLQGYNSFDLNGGNGLHILSNGAVNLTNLHTAQNSSSGLLVNTASLITINKIVATHNSVHGANLTAGGIVTIDKMLAFENGRNNTPNDGTGYGLKVVTSSTNVTVRNSAFSGNGEYGVWASLGASNFLDFYTTTWLGNNRDGGTSNVKVLGGTWRVATHVVP